MAERIVHCTHCNAASTVPEPAPTRILCVKCSEWFSLEVGPTNPPSANLQSEVERHRSARETFARGRWKWIVLSVVVLGAVALFLWWNYRDRGKLPPGQEIASDRVLAPAELPGLGYLMEGCDSVVAIQISPLLNAMGHPNTTDPRPALREWGVPQDVINTLDRLSLIRLENVARIVIGSKLREVALLTDTVVVVQTRQPMVLKDLERNVHGNMLRSRKKDREFLKVPGNQGPFGLDTYWWLPDDRTLIGSFTVDALEQIPLQRREGLEHLAPELRSTIVDQLASDATAWAVLDTSRASLLVPMLSFRSGTFDLGTTKSGNSPLDFLSESRRVRFQIAESPAKLKAHFELKTEPAALAWRKYLEGRIGPKFEVSGTAKEVEVNAPVRK